MQEEKIKYELHDSDTSSKSGKVLLSQIHVQEIKG